MTKKELKEKLNQGFCLSDILPETHGEDCMVYKGEWQISDQVIYIPDYTLNGIIPSRKMLPGEIQNLVENCYTGRDFLDICKGYTKIAKALFAICKWQHPNIQDLLDSIEEPAFEEEFGISLDDFLKEDGNENCNEIPM